MSQPVILGHADVAALLPNVDILAALRRMFRSLSDIGAFQPAQTLRLLPKDGGGLWHSDALRGDLPELLSGRGTPPSRERPAFFRSVGLGLEDIAVAAALLSATRKQNSIKGQEK